jgi:hypothetical protein
VGSFIPTSSEQNGQNIESLSTHLEVLVAEDVAVEDAPELDDVPGFEDVTEFDNVKELEFSAVRFSRFSRAEWMIKAYWYQWQMYY